MRADRPYQVRSIEDLRLAFVAKRSGLLVAPTGAGKTVIASEIIDAAVAKGKRVVFVAHRKELVDQCSARLDAIGVAHGVIMADHPRFCPWLAVQVVSIQTLRARPTLVPEADLVFIDEAHHARARTYSWLLDRYPRARILGLTATPWRVDNKGLGELFEFLVVAARPRELQDLGFLVHATGFAYDVPDLSDVDVTGSDYNAKALGSKMGTTRILGNVVGQWLAHAERERTVVFAVHVEHSQSLVAAFRQRGVPAEHLDGTTPKLEREAILRRLDRGETRVVCNVGVLTEGWDCPRVSCCVLARPTKSIALYLQMVGRVLRPVCMDCGKATDPRVETCQRCGSPNVKRSARIHDHAGCALEHGLPDQDRDYSLKSDLTASRSRSSGPGVRTCSKCFAIYDATRDACPRCGARNPKVVRPVQEVEGRAIAFEELAKLGPVKAPEERRRAYYFGLLKTCETKGYKRFWAKKVFQSRFGLFPLSRWEREFDVDPTGSTELDEQGNVKPKREAVG